MQAPVIKEFVADDPRELRLADLERMFELDAVPITPGINLWIAPAILNPVAATQSKFAHRHANVCAESQTLFPFMFSVWRLGVSMKVKRLKGDVLLNEVIEANSLALVNKRRQVASDSYCSEQHQLGFLIERNRDLNIVPALSVGFGDLRTGLRNQNKSGAEGQTQNGKSPHLW